MTEEGRTFSSKKRKQEKKKKEKKLRIFFSKHKIYLVLVLAKLVLY